MKKLKKLPEHMKRIGLGILSQAQYNALFGNLTYELDNGIWAVLQAAHSAEIIIKSCIAKQHPLLIFSQIPRENSADQQKKSLTFDLLFEHGKTLSFQELPDRLWSCTGYKIKRIKVYNNFGKLRNGIQHFAVPEGKDLSQECVEFIYEVIDPILNIFWSLYAVEYCDGNRETSERLMVLRSRAIKPRIPPTMKADLEKAKTMLG